MPEKPQIINAIENGAFDGALRTLYGNKNGVTKKQKIRYLSVIDNFGKHFPEHGDVDMFSAPGRTEVGGNHTDHNGGRVLAAAIDLDALAAAAKNGGDTVRVYSEGYPPVSVDLNRLTPDESERYTSAALVRGVCARMKELGHSIGGFDAYMASDVLKGSGLSSSAAYEVLIATILNHLFNGGDIDTIHIAQIAQYAENRFFGKPCGLMDMTTCAAGGFVTIDFKDFENPVVDKVDFDFLNSGYAMVIVETGGDHAGLNDDYAAIENEMKSVARYLSGRVLREFSPAAVINNIAGLRDVTGDRAILRALHFYADDARVEGQVRALKTGDFHKFMELVIESGHSSWTLCQNCYLSRSPRVQGVTLALAASERVLGGKGAWRVHGGGFAGTIQAFVSENMLGAYTAAMKTVFGANTCYELIVRPYGAIKLDII